MLIGPYGIAVMCAVTAIVTLALGEWWLSFFLSVWGVVAYWVHEWCRRGGAP